MIETDSDWEALIGLEVHVQLNTRSKLFSRTPNENEANLPNQNANLVDLAYPGTLPVLNHAALEHAVRFGIAIDAPISEVCVFDRKTYFYPDLPKGYQISQFSQPIVGAGMFQLWLGDDQTKPIRIREAHLEEDAGKSIHDRFAGKTALDFNRAGTPLLEIVTEPDLNTAKEAVACFRQIHALVVWLGMCSGKLFEGAMRCDANISVRRGGESNFGTPVELKNLNSFKFLDRALSFEFKRHVELLSTGREVQRETRMFDPATNITKPMRHKEQQEVYRYFPEPDLPPIPISTCYVDEIASHMPELPTIRRQRFIECFGLASEIAYRLTLQKPMADFFEATLKLCNEPFTTANWILGDLTAVINLEHSWSENISITPEQLAQLIIRIKDESISISTGKALIRRLWGTELDVDQVIREQGLLQISDDCQISNWIAKVVEDNVELFPSLLNGQEKLYEYFIGQVMRMSGGKANPQQVRRSLEKQVLAYTEQHSPDKSC